MWYKLKRRAPSAVAEIRQKYTKSIAREQIRGCNRLENKSFVFLLAFLNLSILSEKHGVPQGGRANAGVATDKTCWC
jgi:hypothetical protein